MSLPADEFLCRFLLHLLPRGFVRIRNFGFLPTDVTLDCGHRLRPSKPLIDEMTARNLLNRLREQLSEEQMNALELHFFEGYSLREIADLTGQALGNVRNHFYRGLERVRLNLSSQTDLNERIGTKTAS